MDTSEPQLELQKKAIKEHWLAQFEPGDIVTVPASGHPELLHIVVGMIWLKGYSTWVYYLAEANELNALAQPKLASELQKVEEIPQDSPEDGVQLALNLDVDKL